MNDTGLSNRQWHGRRRIAWAIAAAVLVADQWSKHAVAARCPVGYRARIISGVLDLVHLRNTGAAWGMFAENTGLLSLVSVVVAAGLVMRFRQLAEERADRTVALALILGGILGNLYDRLARGEVVDFILLYYRRFHWPAFNIADTAISCGVALFLVSSLIPGGHESEACTTTHEHQ